CIRNALLSGHKPFAFRSSRQLISRLSIGKPGALASRRTAAAVAAPRRARRLTDLRRAIAGMFDPSQRQHCGNRQRDPFGSFQPACVGRNRGCRVHACCVPLAGSST
ncbi:hypothetical protein, partial [Ralstonia pseudosolanacearum]